MPISEYVKAGPWVDGREVLRRLYFVGSKRDYRVSFNPHAVGSNPRGSVVTHGPSTKAHNLPLPRPTVLLK